MASKTCSEFPPASMQLATMAKWQTHILNLSDRSLRLDAVQTAVRIKTQNKTPNTLPSNPSVAKP
eukprot:501823-Lingulodinium_polyedra.AAC.1